MKHHWFGPRVNSLRVYVVRCFGLVLVVAKLRCFESVSGGSVDNSYSKLE